MTYEYECPKGHTVEVVRSMKDPEPGFVPCPCGLQAKRVVSKPEFMFGATGKHRTADTAERAYGAGHVQLMNAQRETTEWLTAIGAADGHTGDGKSAYALPTGEGVRKKQEMVKAGVKPPESVTYGLKSEFVESIGR